MELFIDNCVIAQNRLNNDTSILPVTVIVNFMTSYYWTLPENTTLLFFQGNLRGRDRMVVGFITTYAISAYHH